MKTISGSRLISAVLAAVLSALLLATSTAAANADAAEFKQGCMKGCVKAPEHEDVCNRQCDCIVSVVREEGGTNSFAKLKLTQPEIQRLNLICTGEVGVGLMTETCNENCKSDQACLRTCSCLSDKIRENRTREEVGTFFNSLASNSGALTQLRDVCVKP
ncbi:MAG: hypothetical protein ACR2PM_11790 [Hyphomicrobiales bacterium]